MDYYCTGPVWQTPTKPGRAAVGTQLPESAYRLMADAHRDHGIEPKPFFAIGGIDADRLPQVLATGATRIVVVRAITEAADPQAAARALSAALRAGEALKSRQIDHPGERAEQQRQFGQAMHPASTAIVGRTPTTVPNHPARTPASGIVPRLTS